MKCEDRCGFVALDLAEPSAPSSGSERSEGDRQQIARASIVPVILSGGSGSRLWPFSTEETPKQFLSFTGSETLFQLSLERVRDRRRFRPPIIVSNERHADLCERELSREDGPHRLLLEPCARNTAPAIVMAAVAARETHGDDILLLVMPSDHIIDDLPAFHEAVATGETAAREGRLVTFGIKPTGADTGFGYIQAGNPLEGVEGAHDVVRFIEKPQLAAAERMVADGQHYWNAGIFLFTVKTFMEEVRATAPDIAHAAQLAVERGRNDRHRLTADVDALSECRSESIDYAVMERSSRVAVVPMAPGWSDLGSWDALASLVSGGSRLGPITTLECDDCYIRSDGVQVAALGVRDLIIVASGQRLLIMPRGRSQEVKKLLSAMESMAA